MIPRQPEARYTASDSPDLLGDCHNNVIAQVALRGGEHVYGWIVWVANKIFDFEFHSVWRSPEGKLIDITPRRDGEKQILFLPDSARTNDGRLTWSNRVYIRDAKAWRFSADGQPTLSERVMF